MAGCRGTRGEEEVVTSGSLQQHLYGLPSGDGSEQAAGSRSACNAACQMALARNSRDMIGTSLFSAICYVFS